MNFIWVSESYSLSLNKAIHLWYTQGQRFVTLSVSPLSHHLVGHLHFKSSLRYRFGDIQRIQKCSILRLCPCRNNSLKHKDLLYTSASNFSSTACLRSIDQSYRMSRLKTTLESVSKAVSGTQAEFLSRIARLKPGARDGGAGAETTPLQNTSTPALVSHPPSSNAAVTSSTSLPVTSSASAPYVQSEVKSKKSQSQTSKTNGQDTPTASTSATPPTIFTSYRPNTHLFHPSSFSANLDETYSYLAHHINSHFSGYATDKEKKTEANDCSDQSSNSSHPAVDNPEVSAPVSDSGSALSPKKGLGHYLTYKPTVQAFVGNYITPLVPRFMTESNRVLPETDKSLPPEMVEDKEKKAAEEKARRLMLQREKIIARVSVDNRTRALVQALRRASDVRLYISRVEELSYHLLEFPETRVVAVKEKVIPCLLRLRKANDLSLKAAVREALTLVGYVDPVKGRGIRILSIDGGGTRGLVALQCLQKLEEMSGKSIYQLFDYICGVSTGAILGFMLGVYHFPLSECEEMYRKLGSDVFRQNVIVGTMKMGWNHAFYDSEIWEKVLKERMGSDLLVETSRNPDCPKVAAVSTVVNKGTPLKAYVFRNYNLPVGVRSHYRGGCQHKLWEAIRASSAAPGYFQEFALGTDLHQDGGLLINNPTALAIHECQCLWPGTPLQCVVSLGTGRFESSSKNNATYTSLKTKLNHVISSATDTEEVHTMLDALLPPNTYFRFNPYMTEDVALDESRSEKLNQLQAEGVRYLERNEEKLKQAVVTLTKEKSSAQRLLECLRVKSQMYSDLPVLSKL
ncbi:calcium-independent phospholipase A2-gamma [Tachysurus fulvidraco]|uniref:calcium-independent phospholipase A2-gamma n=1 Tax=Tachysurus fulvidraco TaxID=1234273 RepID=UPI000F4F1F29|nr:calcium-independent phospholipase A2-gamma [Tachysurus fulvidraco]